MKSLKLISLGITLLISLVFIAQEKKPFNGLNIINRTSYSNTYQKKKTKPLIIVDGKIKRLKYLQKMNPDSIESAEALKDSTAIKKFGEKGKYGAILIKTKKAATKQ